MEPSSGDTLTNLALFNYAFYMDPYIIFIIVWNYWGFGLYPSSRF
jgi:hypothetical protein